MPTEEERLGMRAMPGVVPDLAAVEAIREKLAAMKAGEMKVVERRSFSPLAAAVDGLVEQRDALRHLCGEMLATFELPANAERVELMGPVFAAALAGWRRQFEKCGGEAGV